MTGIILAGGKSRRMGFNKAFLNIHGNRIIDNILSTYKRIFSEIIVVTNTPEYYKSLGVKLIKDVIQNKGPLGGLYTGLLESRDEYCFVSACDMPFIDENLIRYIMSFNDYDIVVPWVEGHYEPLFAMYSKDCLSVIREQIKRDNYNITNIFPKVRVKEVFAEKLKQYDSDLHSLININTPEDLRSILNID